MPKPKRLTAAVASQTLTPPSTLPPHHAIARIKSAAGNNLYNLELASGQPVLAELPSKFRSTIWIRNGSFALVDCSALDERANKIGGEIVNLVGDEKVWRKMSWWPGEFPAVRRVEESESEDEGPRMPPSSDEDGE